MCKNLSRQTISDKKCPRKVVFLGGKEVVLLITALRSYVHQKQHYLKKWALDPRLHAIARFLAHLGAGFALSAAALGNAAQPIALSFICACNGWSALPAAIGSALGYRLFWGDAGWQGVLWSVLSGLVALVAGKLQAFKQKQLLIAMLGSFLVALSGVVFQILWNDTTSVPMYLLRIALAGSCTYLFLLAFAGRDPIVDWLVGGVGVLALAQIPLPGGLSLGYVAAGILAVRGAFPAGALAGLALDLAQITPVPMTAVLCAGYLLRFLPGKLPAVRYFAPVSVCITVMSLCGSFDLAPGIGLLCGSLLGSFFKDPTHIFHRRGETGTVQVRLELAADALSQTQQILLEVPLVPVDENALVQRAAERACGGCPCRRGCTDAKRIAQLPSSVLHKPLLTSEELPIICRKSGRFLAELHRSQEQLRSIQADRERQREYRSAVIQQYQFFSNYLQSLSDQLNVRYAPVKQILQPRVRIFGNREQQDNADRCIHFIGSSCKYYVLLCDGMGTGLGAVQESRSAASLLRRLLQAGLPAESALRSFNSLCALRERPSAATVDLAEVDLSSGKVTLYKWGAAPSYLLNKNGAEKLGHISPPPGLSVDGCQETTEQFSLRKGQRLVLLSDGIGETEAMQCCLKNAGAEDRYLAELLLDAARAGGEDDATVVILRLDPL